tara:strand:+ start:77 stop:457 length:381 start_codon:yes stop_codon:yes gene_type:complete
MNNEITLLIEDIFSNYAWMFMVGVVALLFRTTISRTVDGIMIFAGHNYNTDDVVEIEMEGKTFPGRLVRVGLWSTVIYLYWIKDGEVVGGSKMVVSNDKLKDLKICKPLPLLDLHKYKNNVPVDKK